MSTASAQGLDPKAAPPPAAEKRPKTVGLHGDKIEDPWFWLREKENPAVITHLKAENAYTEAVMAPFKPFEDGLYTEMLGRIKQTDDSVPYRQRGWWIYSRTEEGKSYPLYCRKEGALDAPEQVLLDVNKLAEGQKFMSLGGVALSDDNRLLAFSTDTNGHRDYDFRLRVAATGEEMKTPVGKVSSFLWAADNKTVFFVTENDAKRSYRAWRWTMGEEKPTMLLEEKDELYNMVLDRSSDRSTIFLVSASKRTTEARWIPADAPATEPKLIAKRRNEIEYYPDVRDGVLYLRTNDRGAKEFQVMTSSPRDSSPSKWKTLIPAQKGTKIAGIQLFKDFMVLVERDKGLPQFSVYDFASKKSHRIDFPEPSYDADAGQNAEFDTKEFRFRYQSPITPVSTYDYDLAARTRTLRKRNEVLGGYDPAGYTVERVSAKAKDGTLVPITVVYKKSTPRDGTAPIWLNGYGSYGISNDPNFSTNRLSLLDRGVVCAIGHIRGGGELGEAWHEQGRMMTKMNTFTDFIACADFLVAQKYGAREKMIIEGGSAGGLLIGAVLNLRPDVCRAAVLAVPFVDVMNTMSDATLPLTTEEYIEWGNPNEKKAYAYMKTYSPYDNLAAKAYPSILCLTSLNDSQVPYWEPAKYTAKLRTLKTDSNPLIFKINLDAGHGGASGRYERLREIAFEYTFGLAAVGAIEREAKPAPAAKP